MRKEILLPVVAVIGGGVGFGLRRWELATAFEADTGLPIAGATATTALIVLSVVMAVALLALSRGRYPDFGGCDVAFRAKGNTLYAMAGVLSAFLLLGAGVLAGLEFVRAEEPMYTYLIVGAMAIASGFCVLATVRNHFREAGKGRYSAALLVPAFTYCVWLIAAYQVRAGDPVQLDYVYELFAIIAALLAFYFIAGFSFEKGKPAVTVFFSLLAVYFSLTTLADQHSWSTVLLYCFTILYLLTNSAILLYNAARPLPAKPVENDTEGSSDV